MIKSRNFSFVGALVHVDLVLYGTEFEVQRSDFSFVAELFLFS